MIYDPIEYWNNRIQAHGTINTTHTRISKIEYDFVSLYIQRYSKVLDFGCGDGKLFPVFEEKQCDVTGYDIVDLSKIVIPNILLSGNIK